MIDATAHFPYPRPRDSILDPYLDTAKDWVGDILKGLFGETARPSQRRDLPRAAPRVEETPAERNRLDDSAEQRSLERQREKERLLHLEVVDVNEMLREAVNICQSDMHEKSIELVMDLRGRRW